MLANGRQVCLSVLAACALRCFKLIPRMHTLMPSLLRPQDFLRGRCKKSATSCKYTHDLALAAYACAEAQGFPLQ